MNKRKIEKLIRSQGKDIRPSDEIRLRIQNQLGIETEQKRVTAIRKTTFSYALAGGMAFAVIALVALAIVVSGVGYTGEISESYISIDINPSLELTLSNADTVTGVRAMNEDAVALLYGEDLVGIQIEEALDRVVELSIEIGYIDESSDNAIKYVAINENLEKENQLSNIIKEKLQKKFAEKGVNCEVLAKFGNATSAEAKFQRVSVGKMELIKAVREIDKSLKVPDLKKMSVRELNEIITLYDSSAISAAEEEIEENFTLTRNQLSAEIEIVSSILDDISLRYDAMETTAQENPGNNSEVAELVSEFNAEYPDYDFYYTGSPPAQSYYAELFQHMESVIDELENEKAELQSEYVNAEKTGRKEYAGSGPHGNQNSGGNGQGHGRG
jgi:hypothetical protein